MAIPRTDIELTTVIQAAVQAMLSQIREEFWDGVGTVQMVQFADVAPNLEILHDKEDYDGSERSGKKDSGECRHAARNCFKYGQTGHLQQDGKKDTAASTSGHADKETRYIQPCTPRSGAYLVRGMWNGLWVGDEIGGGTNALPIRVKTPFSLYYGRTQLASVGQWPEDLFEDVSEKDRSKRIAKAWDLCAAFYLVSFVNWSKKRFPLVEKFPSFQIGTNVVNKEFIGVS
ncbi:hypothetical protein Tco_0758337 [Tanacetum coccineum]